MKTLKSFQSGKGFKLVPERLAKHKLRNTYRIIPILIIIIVKENI